VNAERRRHRTGTGSFRVLGLIPARGGSRGISRKNIRILCGKPLLQYTAEVALRAKELSRVVLSTEDAEIAQVGRRCGLEVPFLRPADLARDDTPMLEVVRHALSLLEESGDRFDAVCLLQPTHPLRRAEDIDRCVERLFEIGADAVVTTMRVPTEYHPDWVYFENNEGFLSLPSGDTEPIPRRQDLSAAFHREGSVYVTRRDVVLEGNSLYGARLVGYLLDGKPCVDIDTEEDWERAEALISARQSQGAQDTQRGTGRGILGSGRK